MGHSASEMSSTWMSDPEPWEKYYTQGNTVIDPLRCKKCFCLVDETDWKKHVKYHRNKETE